MKNLGLMVDALEELADLSLELQKADISLCSPTKLISKQAVVFFRKKRQWVTTLYMKASKAVVSGQFNGAALSASANDNKVSEIPKGQFLSGSCWLYISTYVARDWESLKQSCWGIESSYVSQRYVGRVWRMWRSTVSRQIWHAILHSEACLRDFRGSRGSSISPALTQYL